MLSRLSTLIVLATLGIGLSAMPAVAQIFHRNKEVRQVPSVPVCPAEYCHPLPALPTVGATDRDAVLERLRQTLELGGSAAPRSVAVLTLDLLQADPQFPASRTDKSDPAAVDYLSILNCTPTGQAIARTLTGVYAARNYHPRLTDDQVILLRAAVLLGTPVEGGCPDADVWRQAAIVAAVMCDQASGKNADLNSLIVLPWLSLATCGPNPEAVPGAGERAEHKGLALGESVLATRYQHSGKQLDYLFGDCLYETTEKAYRVKARNTLAALENANSLTKKGAYTHYMHQHAVNLAALTLLDYNSDSLSADQFSLLTNAAVADVKAFTGLVRLLVADDTLLIRYDRLIARIQQTAVAPGIDEELARRRDLLRKSVKDSSDRVARAAGDLFENYDTVPSALRDRIELYVPVR